MPYGRLKLGLEGLLIASGITSVVDGEVQLVLSQGESMLCEFEEARRVLLQSLCCEISSFGRRDRRNGNRSKRLNLVRRSSQDPSTPGRRHGQPNMDFG